ncbi:hypothetical protein ACHHYP_12210 [Achlya hypogyna]|uniref:Kinesin motor domain-containing protein n=1 Tax=Achlya hypogyna TaxID=1202772 RepID=A0A1V9ZH24_ACHHY|nr:hypothetical protein ACHHYP_12210 [Achlya hypogyna]
MDLPAEPAVMTAVRVRPMSEDERKAGCRVIVAMDGAQTILTDPAGLSPRSSRRASAPVSPKATLWKQAFTYDRSYWSFDPNHADYADQARLYEDLGTRVVADAWRGFNCSLFAYGQTGAGKSFSMMGSAKGGSSNHSVQPHNRHGLIPRICHGLFETIHGVPDHGRAILVKMSYVEIYNERVYDLLTPDKESLKVREHPDKGAFVEHVSNHVVTSYHDIEYLLGEGAKSRRVAATDMNTLSSRSHAILTLSLRRTVDDATRVSKICMVDLAGSERTELAHGARLREAAYINKSLSALGDVIHALATNVQTPGAVFVQFRNSILTRLLKDSLCGQAKLVMLAAISPCCIHYEETLSTLKYLERVQAALATATPPQMELSRAGSEAELRLEVLALRHQLRIAQQQRDPDADGSPESTGCHHLSVAHLVNLNQDPAFTETTYHCLEAGVTTVGRPRDGDVVPDIVLIGADVLPLHCVFHCADDGGVTVRPAPRAPLFLNGRALLGPEACVVPPGARLTLGAHHVFRFDAPHVGVPGRPAADWSFAHNELLETLLPRHALSTDALGARDVGDAAVSCDLAVSASDIVDTVITCNATVGAKDVVDVAVSCCCYMVSAATATDGVDVADAASQVASVVQQAATQCVSEVDPTVRFSEADKISLERRIAKLKLELKRKERQLKALPSSSQQTTEALAVFALPEPKHFVTVVSVESATDDAVPTTTAATSTDSLVAVATVSTTTDADGATTLSVATVGTSTEDNDVDILATAKILTSASTTALAPQASVATETDTQLCTTVGTDTDVTQTPTMVAVETLTDERPTSTMVSAATLTDEQLHISVSTSTDVTITTIASIGTSTDATGCLDKPLLRIRARLGALLDLSLPDVATDDDPTAIVADIEACVAAVAPPPQHDATLDQSLLRVRAQLAALANLNLADVVLPTADDSKWRADVLDDIEALVLANVVTPRGSAPPGAPYAALLEGYMRDCEHELARLRHATSVQLSAYAKTIAGLETRFTSLCCALNAQCHREQAHFQSTAVATGEALARRLAAKQQALHATSVDHSHLLDELQRRLQDQLDTAATTHQQAHDAWVAELQAFTKTHFDMLASAGAEAAFQDEQARMHVAEWDAKCHRLVVETDAVLSETRAMHARELRRLHDASAAEERALDVARMCAEEDGMCAAEALVRTFEATVAARADERRRWEAQKEDDLRALVAEHTTAMQFLAANQSGLLERAAEARELYGMADEDERGRHRSALAALQAAHDAAVAAHAVELETRRSVARERQALHGRQLAETEAQLQARLAALDAAAVEDATAHARFMKGLKVRQLAEEAQLAATVHASRTLLAAQRRQWIQSAKDVRAAQLALEADHRRRLEDMRLCHTHLVRDLDAAFQLQEATRADELVARRQQWAHDLSAADAAAAEAGSRRAMAVADAEARHTQGLAAAEAAWAAFVAAQAQPDDAPVAEKRAAVAAQQAACDADIEALRAQCSDVERAEVERHKALNEQHKQKLVNAAAIQREALACYEMRCLDAESATVEQLAAAAARAARQRAAMDAEHAARRADLEDARAAREAQHAEALRRIDANQAEVAFTHAATVREMEAAHARALDAARIERAAIEEARLRDFEAGRRRHDWALHEAEQAAANENARCLALVTDLERAHREALFAVHQSLGALEEDQRAWAAAFEARSAQEAAAAASATEAQWATLQATLDATEAAHTARLAELHAHAEADDRVHAADADQQLVAWTERLTCVHMQMEDARSQCAARMDALSVAHARELAAVADEATARTTVFDNARAMAALQAQTARWGGEALAANQQAFYDEAVAALAVQWAKAQADHEARRHAAAANHARRTDVARLAHEATLLAMTQTLKHLQIAYAAELARYGAQLADELAARRVEMATTEATARDALRTDLAADLQRALREQHQCERDAAIAHDAALQALKGQWQVQAARIEMEMEDIAAAHARQCGVAKAAFDADIASFTACNDAARRQTEREVAEGNAMAAAEAESIGVVRADFDAAAAAAHLARQDEMRRTLDTQLRQVLAWRRQKVQLSVTCEADADALHGTCLRLLHALPAQQAPPPIPPMQLQLQRARVGLAIAKATEALANTHHGEALAEVAAVAAACLATHEMAAHDVAIDVSRRRSFSADSDSDASEEAADGAKIAPLEPAAEPSLAPICVDRDKLAAGTLAYVRRPLTRDEEEILRMLTLTGGLVERMEAERRAFRTQCDDHRNAIAKLQAAVQASEAMATVADERARTDAETIALLQDKVKHLVVELPPSPTTTPLSLPSTPTGATDQPLLRGWKS